MGSAGEKAKAETIAQQIDGVKGVRNLLQVVAPPREQAVQVSDDALKSRVEQALRADPSLRASHIAVQSVNQGVVRLAGTAPTLSAHRRAVEVVARVPGVRRVASEVHSPDTLADAEIWREPTRTRRLRRAGGGQRYVDHLRDEDALAGRQPDAGARHQCGHAGGSVTLFGIVPSQQAKAAAAADARQVSGVKRVVNDLQVVASAKQAAVKARDEELARAVKQTFEPPAFKDITVSVKNGVVRLTGTVATGARRLEAAMAARAIPGVRAVKDDLRLATATPA